MRRAAFIVGAIVIAGLFLWVWSATLETYLKALEQHFGFRIPGLGS